MQHIDTLIHAAWVIPVEPEGVVLPQHSLVINDSKIIALLPTADAVGQFSARVTHRLPTHLLIPGFINAHSHAAMNLLRGYADDLSLMTWLHERIWPAEKKWVSPQFVMDGTRLAIAEMLLSGTTCFNDMYYFPDVVGKVAEETGIRAMLGMIVLDFPSAWAQDAQDYLGKVDGIYNKYHHHPLIHIALAPHAPYSVSDKPLAQVAAMADKYDIPIHMHVHETQEEIQQAMQKDPYRPIERLELLGLLSPRLLAVHMTQVNEFEINRLAEKGVHIVHCPHSNLKLASGFAPVHDYLQAGINVALGTDSAASNNNLDMLAEMRTAALLAKGVSQNAAAVSAAQALSMATLNGAKALGLAKITGSLNVGKFADVTALDLGGVINQPIYSPLAHLVYSCTREQISDVWVAGRHLLKDRTLTTLHVRELKAKIFAWRHKILNPR
jgi:5-methylthioadenosine/S-adenosylhomocysteine deaminase